MPIASSNASRGRLIVAALFLSCSSAFAQCAADEVLVGEDDRYYYCGKQIASAHVRGVLKDMDDLLSDGPGSMLGKEWQFRKTVIEAAGRLLRDHYPTYYGGKLQIRQPDGKIFNVCVGPECGGFSGIGVDCSGFLEFAVHTACIVGGFYEGGGRLRLPQGAASDQAEVFRRNGAFIPRWGFPNPGDAVFFRDTDGRATGRITHVSLYMGKTPQGQKMIMNVSYSPQHRRVVFMAVPGNYEEKIVGYGNVSKLFLSAQ